MTGGKFDCIGAMALIHQTNVHQNSGCSLISAQRVGEEILDHSSTVPVQKDREVREFIVRLLCEIFLVWHLSCILCHILPANPWLFWFLCGAV